MAEDAPRGFGEVLRQAREAAGLQVSDVAATTRIGARYIRALEDEDWEVVPGSVIGRGFVRVLAREYRQDAAVLSEAYRAARDEGDAGPDHSLPESDWNVALRPERRVSPLLLGGVAILVAAAGAGYWISRPDPEANVPPPVAAVAPAPAAAPTPVEPAAEAPAPPAATAPVSDAAPPAASGPHRLGIQAVEKVWVRVVADGGEPQDRLLEPGERAEYRGEQGLRVKLGNAGSVRLSWDGAALRVPGAPGEVKTLQFPGAAAALLP